MRTVLLRTAALTLATVSVSLLGATPALAQAYPNRAVKIIVPFAAGGPADVYARFVAQRLQDARQFHRDVTRADNRDALRRCAQIEETIRIDAELRAGNRQPARPRAGRQHNLRRLPPRSPTGLHPGVRRRPARTAPGAGSAWGPVADGVQRGSRPRPGKAS